MDDYSPETGHATRLTDARGYTDGQLSGDQPTFPARGIPQETSRYPQDISRLTLPTESKHHACKYF
jgi:hypothetical protein